MELKGFWGKPARVWSDAAWAIRTTQVLLDARREARELTFVDSRELPGRIAEVRRRVQAQLDLGESEERFTLVSELGLKITQP